MKWPYKEMRIPTDRVSVGGEGADNSDAASDETTADQPAAIDTPREDSATVGSGSAPKDTAAPKSGKRNDDEVKDAVKALLSLTQA